ncbi:MAG: hypothetical protein ABR583_00960 [Gaiellaceae bacterium]
MKVRLALAFVIALLVVAVPSYAGFGMHDGHDFGIAGMHDGHDFGMHDGHDFGAVVA